MLSIIFIFDSRFASKRSYEAAMNVDTGILFMVKINTKGFCKDAIKNLTEYWPVGTYLVSNSKHMVPGDMSLSAISYNYKYHKVVSLIETEVGSIKKSGVPYLS